MGGQHLGTFICPDFMNHSYSQPRSLKKVPKLISVLMMSGQQKPQPDIHTAPLVVTVVRTGAGRPQATQWRIPVTNTAAISMRTHTHTNNNEISMVSQASLIMDFSYKLIGSVTDVISCQLKFVPRTYTFFPATFSSKSENIHILQLALLTFVQQ